MNMKCVNGHDRCYLGPDEKCPTCERPEPKITEEARCMRAFERKFGKTRDKDGNIHLCIIRCELGNFIFVGTVDNKKWATYDVTNPYRIRNVSSS